MAEEVENSENQDGSENLKVLENIDVMLTVEVGRTEITIRDLLRLNEGSVVELDRLAGDPLDIMVNNTKIAKELVFEFRFFFLFLKNFQGFYLQAVLYLNA